jgi:hypothetical protein
MRTGVIAVSLFATSLFGQGTTSRAVGTITDTSGALIAGATVRLTNEATGVTFTTSTTESGAYVFDNVQVGNYTLSVESPGFKRFSTTSNRLSIGQPLTINVTLEVGAVAETIEVSGTAEVVQTSTSGNIGNIFSDRVIRDLPIVGTRGRNPLDLVARQPGVVSGANTGGGVHVNGARDRAWNFTIDGIDSNETSAGGSNFSPLRANPDSLAEFKVLTSNATAEFGRNSGGQVAMVTRSGGNELHGSGFWFYRTPRLNANEWQNNVNNVRRPQFQQQIYGGSIGGPIKRNKMFFFYNAQRLTARNTALVNRTVYTEQARQGIWRYNTAGRNLPSGVAGAAVDPSGNVLPGINIGTYNVVANDPQRLGFNRRIKGLIDTTPLPNNFTGGDGLNTALFTFAAQQNESQLDQTAKVDYVINDKNTVFGRYAWGFQNTNCDSVNGGLPWFPGGACVLDTKRDPRNLALNWRMNPTARTTNEFVFGFNRFAFDFAFPTTDLNAVQLEGTPVTWPEVVSAGNLRRLNTWQVVDNFSYFVGAHNIKFGVNLRFQSHTDDRGSIGGENAVQSVDFSRLINTVDAQAFNLPGAINQQFDRVALESNINFLLGRVGSTGRGFPSEGDQFVAGRYNFRALFDEYDFYVQDTWKVTRNLTLDLGLRWEVKGEPRSDPGGRIRAPNAVMTAGSAPTNTIRWNTGGIYNTDWNNWAPSIGFAWDPFGKGKTSIRSNYRIAFDRINTFVLSSSVFQNLPGQVQGVRTQTHGQAGGRLDNLPVLGPPTARPSDFAQPPAFQLSNITVVDPGFRTPTTHGWSFSIQQEVARNTIVEANYIGRRAYNLFGAYNTNQVDITRNGFGDAFRVVSGGGDSPLVNQLMGPDPRRQATETGSQAMRRLYPTEIRNSAVGTVANDLTRRTVGGRTLPDAAGLTPFFFLPFPQFTGGAAVIDSNDFSTYHGLQVQLIRRFTSGFEGQVGYTWAKSLDTRSFDPAFTVAAGGAAQSASSTPFDINNRRLNYALSDFDRTHVLQSYWVYELPFARNQGGFVGRVIGGWQLSGFLTWQGGRPFTVFSGFNTFSQNQQSTANCSGCSRSDGRAYQRDDGLIWFFSEQEIARMSQPGIGELGSTGRNFFRSPGAFGLDTALLKRTTIREGVNLELRADVTNLTNTVGFGLPTATFTAATFGRIRDTVTTQARKIQLGMKINF